MCSRGRVFMREARGWGRWSLGSDCFCLAPLLFLSLLVHHLFNVAGCTHRLHCTAQCSKISVCVSQCLVQCLCRNLRARVAVCVCCRWRAEGQREALREGVGRHELPSIQR